MFVDKSKHMQDNMPEATKSTVHKILNFRTIEYYAKTEHSTNQPFKSVVTETINAGYTSPAQFMNDLRMALKSKA